MKSKKADLRRTFQPLQRLEFDSRNRLTAYAGVNLLHWLFRSLRLPYRLQQVVPDSPNGSVYGRWRLVLLLIVHFMLGFRRFSHVRFYREDAVVQRCVGLTSLPDERTWSRALSDVTEQEERRFDGLLASLVGERLVSEGFDEVVLDFDGTVLSTKGHAEGTAVGFNKKKKGARSYYPLMCTVAQTSQFLAMHHRSGNVHDSNGACEFVAHCCDSVRSYQPNVVLRARFDSAFYGKHLFETLETENVDFTISVPFQRMPSLKAFITKRKRWRKDPHSAQLGWFEKTIAVEGAKRALRFLFVRQRRTVPLKGPLQLDLFEPVDHTFDFSVIVTNDRTSTASDIIRFHHGRGAQEKLFGEAKQHAALDVIPCKRLAGNRVVTRAAMLAHNLAREFQMRTEPCNRAITPSRTARWRFASLGTLKQTLLHRAAILIRPQGRVTLRMNDNPTVKKRFNELIEKLKPHHPT